jgi:SSS family transporter
MSPQLVFGVLAGYFGLLLMVAYLTTRKANNASFFTANKSSKWYLVSFGMIGASLSGVTFISVPGWVKASGFSYMQMVVGYMLGYVVIAWVLLPLYYKLGLSSIYIYLRQRFGFWSYKTGSSFFILSKIIGASFRLYLVAAVLQLAFFAHFGIPFAVTVFVTIALIWLYTAKGGIKTIVWTDTLQTFFMLAALVATFVLVGKHLNWTIADTLEAVATHPYSQLWVWDWSSKLFFGKQFFAGAFMSIVMTGLDQDMMQKNLTCRNLPESRKNVLWLSAALIPVNLLFLSLGVILYIYAEKMGIALPARADDLFPMLATQHFGNLLGVIFLLGVIAAAFSSADSALTALTTAFCYDFLEFKHDDSPHETRTRRSVHLAFSGVLFLVIYIFYLVHNDSVISAVFTAAGYTYGPLLGLFAYGLFSKRPVADRYTPWIALAAPLLSYFLNLYSKQLLGGYEFGFELLIVNGFTMAIGLHISSYYAAAKKQTER